MKIIWKIVRESFFILILSAIMSSVGGLTLEAVSKKFYAVLPLIIILPAMNDLIGDFGTIISSKFIEWLATKRIDEKEWWKSHLIGDFFTNLMTVAFFSIIYLVILSLLLSYVRGYHITLIFVIKLFIVTMFSALVLVFLIFWISLSIGFWYFKHKKDPSNTLIPLVTSFADMGNIMILTGMVIIFF